MIDIIGAIRNIFTRVGAPAGASVVADIADLITRTKGLNDIHDDLGTHETAQATNRAVVDDIHDTELPAVKIDTGNIKTQTDKIPHIALCITQWGGFEDELDISIASVGTLDAATKLTPTLPTGATVWKAYLVFKFREIYCAAANYIGTAGTVEVQKSTEGSWVAGITIPTGAMDVAAGASAAGDCLIGNADVSAQIASGSEVEFRLNTIRANADNLLLRDIQVGLQIYFTI